jgi:hypothetical protein
LNGASFSPWSRIAAIQAISSSEFMSQQDCFITTSSETTRPSEGVPSGIEVDAGRKEVALTEGQTPVAPDPALSARPPMPVSGSRVATSPRRRTMKSSSLLLALVLVSATPVALAQVTEEEEHSAHHPAADAPAEAVVPAEHDHSAGKPDPAQENMKRIEGLMKQIQESANPDRKRMLLGEHLRALLAQMKLVRGQNEVTKAAMKPTEKRDGDMMGGAMKGGGMMKMHKRMEQRIDMLERLLQQTLERQAVEE